MPPNGLLKSGDRFQLDIDVRNDGGRAIEEIQVYLESLNPAATVLTPTITIPLIEMKSYSKVDGGFTVEMGDVDPCGKTLNFHVHLTNSQGTTLVDPVDILVGTEQLKFDWLHDDADWTVNPDASDTVSTGEWKLGEPECSLVLGVVTQPERDHTPGEGELAFHTGPKKGTNFSADDVDGGRTTVQSPIFAIGDARYPYLVYYAWHVAVDLTSNDGPLPVPEDLIVQASNDGGQSWIEIDRVWTNTEDWERRTIPLAQHLEVTNRMQFRFEIGDNSLVATVEAGIDDLEILDLKAHCDVPAITQAPVSPVSGAKATVEQGCSCQSYTVEQTATYWLLLLLIPLLMRRRFVD